jgi:putative restriction endonuclease
MTEFDEAFFKVLSPNDVGETGGHQGGIVIPRRIVQYFPSLPKRTGPTTDADITAELYDGDKPFDVVTTRFQMQTWGGERSPEYRLTRNLKPFLDRANGGDMLLFQRVRDQTDRFRITLLQKASSEFDHVQASVKGKTSGPTDPAQPPVPGDDLLTAIESLEKQVFGPFVPTEPPKVKISIVQRRLRTEAFKISVRKVYDMRCALCNGGLRTPDDLSEVQAAHIIPRSANGTNDPRNGIALCQGHHWAFDQYLWTLSKDRRVIVPGRTAGLALNVSLVPFKGHPIRNPAVPAFRPADEALTWHHERTVQKWGK